MDYPMQVTVFLASGIVATMASIWKKWYTSPDDVSLLAYFGKDHGKYTMASIGTFLGSALALIGPGFLDGQDTYHIVYAGVTAALAIDGQIGKSARSFVKQAVTKTAENAGLATADALREAGVDPTRPMLCTALCLRATHHRTES